MINSYQIVIDTNVILAGLRSKNGASYKLLSILNDKRFQINISATLIFEYEEILKREKKQIGLTNEEIDEKFGVSILNPKQFLQLLGEINP